MRPKTLFKIMLDLVLLVMYCQLMFAYAISPLFHEVAGIAIGCLFIIHVAINWKPIRALVRSWQAGRLSPLRALLLLTDIILPVGMFISIVSGLLIATELFIGPGGPAIVVLHNVVSYVCLVILALHTVLHAKYLVTVTRKILNGPTFQKTASCTAAAMLVFALFGVNLVYAYKDDTSGTDSVSESDVQTMAQVATVEDSGVSSEYNRTDEADAASASTSSSSSIDNSAAAEDSSSTSSGSIVCTLCGKACPLGAFQCGRGTKWAQSNGYM